MASIARGRTRAVVVLAVALVAAWLSPRRVDAACTASVSSGVSFGAYNVFSRSPVDSTGQVQYECTGKDRPSLRITLSRGQSTTYAARRLTSGSEFLLYNLYLDAARTTVWGDETDGTQAYYSTWGGKTPVVLNIYGRIPAGQDVAVGTYSDTISVVVNF